MAPSLDQILLVLVFVVFGTLIVLDDGEANIKTQCINSDDGTCIERKSATDVLSGNKNNKNNEIINGAYDQCIDHDSRCSKLASLGYCQKNHTKMLRECPSSCNSCDDLDWNENKPGCPNKYPTCEDCKDKLAQCKHWKSVGECMRHPGYMVINCAKTCKYCHLQSDYSLRCPMNKDYMSQTRVFPKPGDLNTMFENIITLYNSHKNQTEDDGEITWDLEILSRDPWILRFDNFFDQKEADGIIGAAGKFERSTDVGKKDETGHFAVCFYIFFVYV